MIYILNLDKTFIYPFDIHNVRFIRKGCEIIAVSRYINVLLAKYDDDMCAVKAMDALIFAISKGRTSFSFEKYEQEMSLQDIIVKIE